LAAVFAFPLRDRASRFGALDLYRDTPGPLAPTALASAQTLADIASAYLLNATARFDLHGPLHQSQGATLRDPSTGMANRALLLEFLDQALRRAGLFESLTGVLFCEIDRFKESTNPFEQQVGAELLEAVTNRLSALLRPSDTLVRLAGDEFVIVCEGLKEPPDMQLIANRVVDSLAAPFSLSSGRVHVGAGVGVAIGGESDIASFDLLNDAENAMYRAKLHAGRPQGLDTLEGPSAETFSDDQTPLERLLLSSRKWLA
jgi:diguanylate cyclase (GGDEF)-like protein